VFAKTVPINRQDPANCKASSGWWTIFVLTIAGLFSAVSLCGQNETPAWQSQVHKYAEARDWDSAMRIVDQQVARAPQDMDVREWRARILTWSGRRGEAEVEYMELLKVSQADPDLWTALGAIYLSEGKIKEAQHAVDAAEELDPKRADLHAARGRVFRAAGLRDEARLEFQKALNLDPSSTEARAGLLSVRGEPKHELRLGQDNDVFNFTGANHDEWTSLVSQWNSHWTTSIAGDLYQRGGTYAGKFAGSITRRQPKWGAATVGGAIGHDNGVIPKSEAFFDLDRGWKTGETNFLRGMEFTYGQHWYWYQTSRILALNGAGILYFPREWTLTLATTGARSAFSGTGAEWRPSVVSRLGFPWAHWGEKGLSGNVFFAVGNENFAQVDQIGRFASQTYGGGLRFQINARQDVTGYAAYQKRTQNRSETSSGFSYAIHF
jgi:tetratricopeptide (TPR) repeat protein